MWNLERYLVREFIGQLRNVMSYCVPDMSAAFQTQCVPCLKFFLEINHRPVQKYIV